MDTLEPLDSFALQQSKVSHVSSAIRLSTIMFIPPYCKAIQIAAALHKPHTYHTSFPDQRRWYFPLKPDSFLIPLDLNEYAIFGRLSFWAENCPRCIIVWIIHPDLYYVRISMLEKLPQPNIPHLSIEVVIHGLSATRLGLIRIIVDMLIAAVHNITYAAARLTPAVVS